MKRQPLLLYDNSCSICKRFAMLASSISRGWIIIIGHYSEMGEEFSKHLGSNAKDMFWIITDGMAYGGRYGLIPLIKEIIRGIFNKRALANSIGEYQCLSSCSLFSRIKSIISKGKKIKMELSYSDIC